MLLRELEIRVLYLQARHVHHLNIIAPGTHGTVLVVNGNPSWGGLSSQHGILFHDNSTILIFFEVMWSSGAYFLSLQSRTTTQDVFLSQRLEGLKVRQKYELNFLAADRPGRSADETFKVFLDDKEIWESTHPGSDKFTRFEVQFTATNTTHMLRFENDSPTGDNSVFLDDITVTFPAPRYTLRLFLCTSL